MKMSWDMEEEAAEHQKQIAMLEAEVQLLHQDATAARVALAQVMQQLLKGKPDAAMRVIQRFHRGPRKAKP